MNQANLNKPPLLDAQGNTGKFGCSVKTKEGKQGYSHYRYLLAVNAILVAAILITIHHIVSPPLSPHRPPKKKSIYSPRPHRMIEPRSQSEPTNPAWL
jgi:hypothetical protein